MLRRVTGEDTVTPCARRHVLSWFRAVTTAADAEVEPLALLPPPEELLEELHAASVSTRSMARLTAASRPCRRLFLVKAVPFLSLGAGPRDAGRFARTAQRSGGKTSVKPGFTLS
jgi:hypothetical protein